MRSYDEACAKNYNRFQLQSMPLSMWDFKINNFSDTALFEKIQRLWSVQHNYLKQSQRENRELIITNQDFKIVFASHSISKISGYRVDEILGKSPALFQGEKTCPTARKAIKKAIQNLQPFKEVVLNYKKNGETYWCEIEAYPMFDRKGVFKNYIALEKIAS